VSGNKFYAKKFHTQQLRKVEVPKMFTTLKTLGVVFKHGK